MSLFSRTTTQIQLHPAPPSEPNDHRVRWFELGLVLLVAFSGSVFTSIYFLRAGPPSAPRISMLQWIASGVHQLIGLLLLGYVLARRSRSFRDLGLAWSLRDVAVGCGLTFAAFFSYLIGVVLLRSLHTRIFGTPGSSAAGRDFFLHPGIAGLLFTLINAPFEELIVRAYVMTEISDLTGSILLAGVASVAIQISYHLYYGVQGALSVGFLFLVFTIYYAQNRRALPIVTAHALFDLYAIYRLW